MCIRDSHKIGDVDSFGAAIGIYRAAKTINKRAYIVINEITSSVRPVIDRFINDSEYEDDMFLTSEEALDIVDMNTAVVVVDVNKPDYTECMELLSRTKTIVILDHHRRSKDTIEGAVLSYICLLYTSRCV